MNRLLLTANVLALSASAALAQPTAVKSPDQAAVAKVIADAQRMGVTKIGYTNTSTAQSQVTLIKHGHVYSLGAAGTMNDADVLIQNGKIAQVGANLTAPPGATVIDAHGKPVTPGLMVSATQLGIVEVDLVSESNDSGPGLDLSHDDADGYTAGPKGREKVASAAFDVTDAINPKSTLIPVARVAGVTRSATLPALGDGVFRGQGAVIDLGNETNLVNKTKIGMVVNLSSGGGDGSRPVLWAEFRETLDDAREYLADRGGYHRPGGARDQRSNRIDLDALEPVIHGREPLVVYVDRASDIRQVLQYCQTNKLKLIILGGQEAWQVAGDLAAAHVPVVIDSELNLPGSFSALAATLKNAARLDDAGVTVVFEPQGGTAHYARTITQIAGNAVANGMKWDHALAAITKNPAMVWGIGDTYGTLEAGKDADVVVWDGDPLQVTSAPTAVFIKGAQMPMTSRQTELRDRYRDLDKKGMPFGYR